MPSVGSTYTVGLPTIGSINADALIEHARASGEPAWLQQRRGDAWHYYATHDRPPWKRTDLTKLRIDMLTPTSDAGSTGLQWDPSLSQQGVVFTTLKAAIRTHGELIEQYLGKAIDPQGNTFNALHAALWQDGVLLYVPKNVVLEQPLHVVYTSPAGGTAVAPHSLIIVERGAQATFVEEFSSSDDAGQALALPHTEVFIGDGANLRLCSVQQWGNEVYHIGGQRVLFGRDAGCEWVGVSLGAKVQHVDAEARLGSDGSHVNWLGATFANHDQTLLTGPWLRHAANSTEGFMQFKTVVSDAGYSVFDGMVRIEGDTHGTISRLEEHAIHLSRESRNDSIPGLMIDSNDIARAGHASTSGRIDEEQLFYMQARGINKAEATRIIIMGFLASVLDAIPVDDLRERLAMAVEEKI